MLRLFPEVTLAHEPNSLKSRMMEKDYVLLRWEKGAYLLLGSEEKERILNSSNAGYFS